MTFRYFPALASVIDCTQTLFQSIVLVITDKTAQKHILTTCSFRGNFQVAEGTNLKLEQSLPDFTNPKNKLEPALIIDNKGKRLRNG